MTETPDRIPVFKIIVADKDITQIVSKRLVSLSITECRGDESDQVDITLDDEDGLLALPPCGAKVSVFLGWKGSPLVDKGVFHVDEVEHSGPPDIVTIRARSANLMDTFTQLQERSFHETTVGAIIRSIAAAHSLKPAIADGIGKTPIKHIAQTHESDAAFLRRLGKMFDAVATVKHDRLLFVPIGSGRTISGAPLPVVHIARQDGDTHRYPQAARDSHSGVRAFWYDGHSAQRHSVVAGAPGNSKRLRTTFGNRHDAMKAAEAEWKRIQRGVAEFEMTLAIGDLSIMPESPVVVSGYNAAINAGKWIAENVTHTVGEAGLTSRVECETRHSDRT